MTLRPGELALLERTLRLAEQGRPAARPNPVVGAVLARADGTVLAEGFHARYGGPHAERAALVRLAAPVPADATMYVSLEPCAHHGKQPPCTDAILEAGIRRVVVGCADSNPETAGIGIARLEAAGVEVAWAPPPLAVRARAQNAGFHRVHAGGLPWVTYKWAMTRNGRLATGDPTRRWISGPDSRELVHYMRAGSGAVAVGIGTVLADDPLLTVRGKLADRVLTQPLRVVYDRSLRLPLTSALVRSAAQAPVLAVAGPDAPADRQAALEASGVEVVRTTGAGPAALRESLEVLARRHVHDVLLESGPTLATAFYEAGLLDVLACFEAPIEAPADQPGLDEDHPLRAALAGATPRAVGMDSFRICSCTNSPTG